MYRSTSTSHLVSGENIIAEHDCTRFPVKKQKNEYDIQQGQFTENIKLKMCLRKSDRKRSAVSHLITYFVSSAQARTDPAGLFLLSLTLLCEIDENMHFR